MPVTNAQACLFGVACIASVVYGKLPQDHPLKAMPLLVVLFSFLVGVSI